MAMTPAIIVMAAIIWVFVILSFKKKCAKIIVGKEKAELSITTILTYDVLLKP